MANKTLFKSLVGKLIPAADARNEHRAPAYALTPKQALAQYAATGCLGATFYAGAGEQLETRDQQIFLLAERDRRAPLLPAVRRSGGTVVAGAEKADGDCLHAVDSKRLSFWIEIVSDRILHNA